MKNWNELIELESNIVWDYINNVLRFDPYSENKKYISLPIPNKCFDISNFYDDGFSENLYDGLHESSLKWFKHISNGQRLYAVNWRHESYSFFSELPFEKDEFDEWLIPMFPNGDYTFFLSKDFKNGIFADGVHLSIHLFGKETIQIFEKEKPEILVLSNSCD